MDEDKFYGALLDLLLKAKKEMDSEQINQNIENVLELLELKEKYKPTREELLKRLGKMLTQVVVLCNHVAGGREPNEDYVNEKLTTYPVLDFPNQAVFDRIVNILEPRYDVSLQRHSWG